MIVRNAGATIERALRSVVDWVDEVVIAVDDKTDDRTKERIAEVQADFPNVTFTVFDAKSPLVIGIPSGVTEVEKRAVIDAAVNAGARQAFLIEEPMAASVGARLPVQDAQGSMIVDIGGGTSEIAVLSLGGVVIARSIRIAGDEMNENIIQYARDNFNLLVGPRSAEEVKIKIGSAYPLSEPLHTTIRGRDLVSGLPKEITITDTHVREALSPSIRIIVNNIKNVVEEIPPEIISDIMHRGIVLAGGGALLRGLDKLIMEETQMPVNVADDPLTCVVRGAGIVVEDLETLKDVLLPTNFERIPR
jgi:rod shape-determining protein MreB